MKISIGVNIQPGPWGGGNQFCQSLYSFLEKKKVDVSFDLKQKNLDLILLVEPRSDLKISAYNHIDILRYQLYKNSNAIVVHRINGYYRKKGTNEINQTLKRANLLADYSIYLSRWLQDVYGKYGFNINNSKVIMNGANRNIFNDNGYQVWKKNTTLRLVTHHWGANYQKGFDVYERLDQLLSSPAFSNKFEFMFIGNLPGSIHFEHIKWKEPKIGQELASLIRSNHVYLTAAQNEGAGMHHIEGALCGLPILYRESGALPEYCNGYGIGFTIDTFETKLEEMYHDYNKWVKKMPKYPYDSDRMCEQYYELILELLDRHNDIIRVRGNRKSLSLYLKSLLPEKLLKKIIGKLKYWIS